jgi:CRP/FNR family nitrogen fixation transcriptional regulator
MNLNTISAGAGRVSFTTGPVLYFAPDQEVYGQGDTADTFIKLLSGVIRTCHCLHDGRRQIDAFHVPGDVFGFEFGTEHSLSAEAVNHTTVISYRWRGDARHGDARHGNARHDDPRYGESRHENALRGMPGLANADGLPERLFGHAMRNLSRAQDHARLLGRSSALEKMATFLLEWSAQSPDRKLLTLVMSRQDIADYLGLTVETISRTLTQLKQEGLIQLLSARQIRLTSLSALREMTD